MKNDDFDFYGKGLDGYVHYTQAFDETQKDAPPGAKKTGAKSAVKLNPFVTVVEIILAAVAVYLVLRYL